MEVLGQPGWVQLEDMGVMLQRKAPGGHFWEGGREGGRVCHSILEGQLALGSVGWEPALLPGMWRIGRWRPCCRGRGAFWENS